MINLINMLNITDDIEKIIYVLKLLYINLFTYYTFCKVTDVKNISRKNILIVFSMTIVISIICGEVKYSLDYLSSILCLIILMAGVYTITNNNQFIDNMIRFIICLAINYVVHFVSIIVTFFPNIIFLDAQNDWLNLFLMMVIHLVIIFTVFKIKRFKNGFQFLKQKNKSDYFDILILNISITILFSFIIAKNITAFYMSNLFLNLVLLAIIIFITIKKTLTMYYKHKMLIKDLNETKDELDKKIKEVEKLEQENIEISKKSHSISHKIKSLNQKVEKLMMNSEIADEIDIKDRIKEITNEYYKDKVVVELSKTGINVLDDMLDYMKNECIESGIDFELQLNGNIHYMTNNCVSKEELEILLADHIKDAIIAIKHSDNVNRSILVRLGMIDEFYSLYIYDSGIEFEIDTLINLGIKPVTTYADEDGTGMGFLNTFDTLKKHNASLIINEIGKPGKDNYTKVIMIKFDGKGEFVIKSYRSKYVLEKNNRKDIKVEE